MAKWLTGILCSLAVLAVLAGVSAAGELTVFGPKQYIRTADTTFYQDHFSAQVGPAHFEVTVGNPDGTNTVSSARVFLNGSQLLYPDDFPNKGRTYQFPVNLTANNVLTVEINGAPGGFLTILVTPGDNIQTITARADAGGTISPSGSVTVNYGADQTFTITPNPNCYVGDVLVDDVSMGAVTTFTFNDVTANHTIAVTCPIKTLIITASAGSNGIISPSGAVSVNYGSDQTFTITPAPHYHVADVLVDGVSKGTLTTYTFNDVTANHTIAATFAINTYTLTPSAGAHGSITPPAPVTVDYGGSQTFNFLPETGYHVKEVKVDGTPVPGAPASHTFNNVTANHTIDVTFAINTYTLTPSAGAHGNITPAGAGNGGLRRQPDLQLPPGDRLSRQRGQGGRDPGARGARQPYLQQRHRQPHH